ncbi:MAG: alpha/beta fold hydrolase [Polyangiaceae bacterium]|nr:alpha/beta fold hydrolase [Polyangiaceae bacterium]
MQRWRGLKGLVHDAVDATLELVREGHDSAARSVLRVTDEFEPLREPARAVDGVRRLSTGGVLGTIGLVNRIVENVTDRGLDLAEGRRRAQPGAQSALPMRSDVAATAPWLGDAALALVNAAVGDHLHARGNGLDLGMRFRVGDHYVAPEPEPLRRALPSATPKLAVFVHGLGTTEWSWCLESEAYHGDPSTSFGTLLARDLDFTPVYLRYNAGRHVSENGRLLAGELERLVSAYPVSIEQIVLLGHSMGGLVVRSAYHYAAVENLRWAEATRRIVCLGAPHQGAPLAKVAHALGGVLGAIDVPAARIGARIFDRRSAGIRDLRHGAIVDEDWLVSEPEALETELPPRCRASFCFLSATLTKDPEHPLGRLAGDLLVRVPSASGPKLSRRTFAIETKRFGGVLHHQLQNHPAVYDEVRRVCSGEPSTAG